MVLSCICFVLGDVSVDSFDFFYVVRRCNTVSSSGNVMDLKQGYDFAY